MKHCPWIFRSFTAVAAVLACVSTQAAPVSLSLQGTVNNTELSSLGLGTGAAVSLSLNFNETFSDGSYDFSDPLGPVSGAMTVAGFSYILNGASAFTYSVLPSGEVASVQLQFTGIGPSLGGGDFFGLFARFTPSFAVDFVSVGYGFTTDSGNGSSATSIFYANVTPSNYSITPNSPGQVPVPATLPLVLLGLLGLPAVTLARRRTG